LVATNLFSKEDYLLIVIGGKFGGYFGFALYRKRYFNKQLKT
jgi:hypothetical protein